MRRAAVAAAGAGGLAMLLLLLPGADDEVVVPPLPSTSASETSPMTTLNHTYAAPISATPRRRSARAVARTALEPRRPAREPAFELSALVAHDDARAVAELVRNGSLHPRALVDRILSPASTPAERALLIDALGRAQSPAAQAALATLGQDPLLAPDLVAQAYDALGRVRRPSEATLAHLRRVRLDTRPVQRAAAVRALGLLARMAGSPLLRNSLTRELLTDLREARDPTRRLELVGGIAQTGHPAAQNVLARLTDAPRPRVRALAGEGLGRIPGVGAEVQLLTLLEEGLVGDRAVAASALAGRAPTVEAVGALCDAAVHDQAEPVRFTAVAALSSWNGHRAVPAVMQRRIERTLARLAAGEGAVAASAREAITPKG